MEIRVPVSPFVNCEFPCNLVSVLRQQLLSVFIICHSMQVDFRRQLWFQTKPVYKAWYSYIVLHWIYKTNYWRRNYFLSFSYSKFCCEEVSKCSSTKPKQQLVRFSIWVPWFLVLLFFLKPWHFRFWWLIQQIIEVKF